MPSWSELTQQLPQIVDGVVRLVKSRRREWSFVILGGALLWMGYAFASWLPAELKEFLNQWRGVLILQVLLYVAGGAVFGYGAYRIWRLTQAPDLPPLQDRPSAIKGPMAFTPGDGELFRKLGRESELRELLGYVDDNQVALVTLMGASGAGKTSLLRAGLTHILQNKGVKYHYWEALPTNSAERLLRAIQDEWHANGGAEQTVPASLDDLVNPSAELCPQPHVIVLDQFEQLRGNKAIFRLLSKIVREARPPHRITWIIAFRREFSAHWRDFIIAEQKREFTSPREMSLRLFTAKQAQEVIGQLINEAHLSIEQAVVNNLMEAATTEQEVLPVDIGIGLLVLAELHERQSGKTVTIQDYQFAGEAAGLLTQYINRCLERFPETERDTILKAMLELRNPETNQRLAEGLPAADIAARLGVVPQHLKLLLDHLSQRGVRLLETVATPTETRYRLPHERLIPALHRLTGKILAEVDQAKLKFEKAFLVWQGNNKQAAYALKGKDLQLIERFVSQIPWGSNAQEKKAFLQHSQRRRTFVRAAIATAVLALFGAGWGASLFYQQYEGKRYLRESGYPPELYGWQHQLKKLELTEPLDLERFTWLHSDSIEELTLHAAPSSNSIAGLASLAKCHSLKKLTLDLSSSQVSSVEVLKELKNLTQLTLDLPESQVINLKVLKELKILTEFSLEGSGQPINLLDLKELKNLTHLSLNDLNPSFNLDALKEFKGLTHLSLDLSYSVIGNTDFLKELKELTNVSLILRSVTPYNQVSFVDALKELKNLTQLSLDLSNSQVSNLDALKELKGLTQLSLVLDDQGSNLGVLKELQNLSQLSIALNGEEINLDSLKELKGLSYLSFKLSGETKELNRLKELKVLTQLSLDLGYSQMSNVDALKELKNLTQLSLDLSDSQVSNLDALKELKSLTQLSLILSPSDSNNLLRILTYNKNKVDIDRLDILRELKELTHLSLVLNDKVGNLEVLRELLNLRKLSLKKLKRIQRMSFHQIPAHLTELAF